MKILKEGVKPTAKVKCPKCKAELEVELEDKEEEDEEVPTEEVPVEEVPELNEIEKVLEDALNKIAELEAEIENLTKKNDEVLKEVEVLKSKPVVSARLKAYESTKVINMRKVEKEESSTLSVIAELRKKNNK